MLDTFRPKGFSTLMPNRELSQRQQKTIYIIALALALTVMALAVIFVGIPIVRFIKEPERFRQWVRVRGIWGKIAYVGMVTLKVILVVIPGEPFEMAAGYAFGTWEGLLLCVMGITIGSIIVFCTVKKFGLSIVRVFFSQKKIDSMKFLHTSKRQNAFLAVVYMIPGTPKELLNYYAGLTDIKLWTWAIVCSVGRVPSIIASTIAGDALEQKKYSLGIIITGVSVVVGLIALLILRKVVTEKGEEPEDDKAGA